MKIIIITFMMINLTIAQTPFNEINELIKIGEFSKAAELINDKLSSKNLSYAETFLLQFELERMDRIRKDFNKTQDDILKFVRKYYPNADENSLRIWEENGSLEYKIIDGNKWYFSRAAANLFRINKEAKKQKELIDGPYKEPLYEFLEEYVPLTIEASKNKNTKFVKPVRLKLNYTVTLKANAVPQGEVVRCWLPFPREGHNRQTEVKLLAINSSEYIIASNDNQQRTIYFEKVAQKDLPTIFNVAFEVKNYAEVNLIDPESIKPYNKNLGVYQTFTAESFPHIVFTDKIKELSSEIVGDEKNPYLIAKKIFSWISENIPWAGAREYSTIENISEYCLERKHGDCGIKTLLFMTLCRYNGIPAKWQSGWMLHPNEVNLHDWCEIFLEGYGWIPVDQSFGLINSNKEEVKYFFLGSIDPYHLITNDDYSSPLFPTKIFPRSETVDFQRGELEWRGGNLYFDKWDYKMEVEYIEE